MRRLLVRVGVAMALLSCRGSSTEATSTTQRAAGGRAPQDRSASAPSEGGAVDVGAADVGARGGPAATALRRLPPRLVNRVAYIPPPCFTKTRDESGTARNPCYACHTRGEPPNAVDDGDLQVHLSLPGAAAHNPWTNVLTPPRGPAMTDEAILAYVRASNYFDAQGNITLANQLRAMPSTWDENANGRWDGFVPDLWFHFDDRGFDHRPDGQFSGWRAFAYYPFLGMFFPTNGSTDDVAIRLDSPFREDSRGQFDQSVYEVNLAIVEALIRRVNITIDPVDETAWGVDIDLNGHLGMATRVTFDGQGDTGQTRMHYVGRAHDLEATSYLPIAPGLFPIGTEFFHTVRYLDIAPDGTVTMAPRMKEVRYAKKHHWAGYALARDFAKREALEQEESPTRTHDVHSVGEGGVATRTWIFEGFIEDEKGALRPQNYEETAFCEGCHNGIGATTDSTFAFARKIGDTGAARGWFHWSQHGLKGIREPRRVDGRYEYTEYLQRAGAGDELRENAEVLGHFFDEQHALRPVEVSRLHADISQLLVPSGGRALDLDRAYHAIVLAQSFDRGRDAVLAPARHVYADAPLGDATGIREPAVSRRLGP